MLISRKPPQRLPESKLPLVVTDCQMCDCTSWLALRAPMTSSYGPQWRQIRTPVHRGGEEGVEAVRHRHPQQSLRSCPDRAGARQPRPVAWRHRRRAGMAKAPMGRRVGRCRHGLRGLAAGLDVDEGRRLKHWQRQTAGVRRWFRYVDVMKLGFEESQSSYNSGSQKARAWTEAWVRAWAYCPHCGNAKISSFPTTIRSRISSALSATKSLN